MTTLFEPARAGALSLLNRIVMAPLTRNRAPGAIPTPLMATYYVQRASAGLIVTEATAISHQAQGYADVPGLWSDEQVAAWKTVTDAVHAAGGRIVVQLWHVGRVSHVDLQPGGQAPVAPSAITPRTKTWAYVLSAIIPGMVGVLFYFKNGNIEPGVAFRLHFSIEMIVMVMLGGQGTVLGPIIGAIGYQRLRGFLLTSELFKNIQLSVAGLLLLLIILFIPAGAVGWVRQRFPVLRRYLP